MSGAQPTSKRLLTEANAAAIYLAQADAQATTDSVLANANAIAATGSVSFDPTLLPFTSNSPWRLGISQLAKFALDSDARHASMQSDLANAGTAWVNSYQYSHPVAQVEFTDPYATVTDFKHTNVNGIPQGGSWQEYWPATAKIAAGTDRQSHVITPERRDVIEHFDTRRNSTTDYAVARRHRVSLYGSGLGPQNGTRAYGGSAIGGLIRAWEVDPSHPAYTGRIDHPLAMSLTQAKMLFTAALPDEGYGTAYGSDGYGLRLGYVWPATEQDFASDTGYHGTVQMGSYWAIKPSVDITTLGLSAAGLMVAKAMQDYGVYITDTSGTTALYVEDTISNANVDAWVTSIKANTQRDLKALYNLLRVVTSNGPTTPNGGPLTAARRGIGQTPIVARSAVDNGLGGITL